MQQKRTRSPKGAVTGRARNNIRQAQVEEGRCRYLFVDSADHRADRIIMGSLIPTRFLPLDEHDTRNRKLGQAAIGKAGEPTDAPEGPSEPEDAATKGEPANAAEPPVAEPAPYELRLCAFDERYEGWFLCAMEDLEWILEAEGPYLEACEQLLGAPVVIRAAQSELAGQWGLFGKRGLGAAASA